VGGRQLEWPGTLHVCQHEGGDLLLVVVPRHGSHGRPMRSCTLVDLLGAHAVRQLGLLLGCRGKDVLGKFSI
jgi:hypothetical protein